MMRKSLSVLVVVLGMCSGSAVGQEMQQVQGLAQIGVAVKVGLAGVGLDVATPLTRRFNLRAGVSIFSYETTAIGYDGFSADAKIDLRTVSGSVDFFPFGGSFRVSPGFVMYNGNHISAITSVPGGQTFTLDDVDYISDPTNPVHGTADMKFGNVLAPSFTIGWGNLIQRVTSRGPAKHWSVPFEVGFEYVGPPKVALTLAGSVCQVPTVANGNQTGCQDVTTDAETQQNLQDVVTQANSDLRPLRFYPILSLGVGYRF